MHVQLETTAKISKSVSIRREKVSDDTEHVIACMKFSETPIFREAIDEIVGRPIGWAESCLFDALGAPIARMIIHLPMLKFTATGVIRGGADVDKLTLTGAQLSNVCLTLVDKGAYLAGELTWGVAGDEVSDLEQLLGRLCMLHLVLQDSGQQSLLDAE